MADPKRAKRAGVEFHASETSSVLPRAHGLSSLPELHQWLKETFSALDSFAVVSPSDSPGGREVVMDEENWRAMLETSDRLEVINTSEWQGFDRIPDESLLDKNNLTAVSALCEAVDNSIEACMHASVASAHQDEANYRGAVQVLFQVLEGETVPFRLQIRDTGVGMGEQQISAWVVAGKNNTSDRASFPKYTWEDATITDCSRTSKLELEEYFTGNIGRFGVGINNALYKLGASFGLVTRRVGSAFQTHVKYNKRTIDEAKSWAPAQKRHVLAKPDAPLHCSDVTVDAVSPHSGLRVDDESWDQLKVILTRIYYFYVHGTGALEEKIAELVGDGAPEPPANKRGKRLLAQAPQLIFSRSMYRPLDEKPNKQENALASDSFTIETEWIKKARDCFPFRISIDLPRYQGETEAITIQGVFFYFPCENGVETVPEVADDAYESSNTNLRVTYYREGRLMHQEVELLSHLLKERRTANMPAAPQRVLNRVRGFVFLPPSIEVQNDKARLNPSGALLRLVQKKAPMKAFQAQVNQWAVSCNKHLDNEVSFEGASEYDRDSQRTYYKMVSFSGKTISQQDPVKWDWKKGVHYGLVQRFYHQGRVAGSTGVAEVMRVDKVSPEMVEDTVDIKSLKPLTQAQYDAGKAQASAARKKHSVSDWDISVLRDGREVHLGKEVKAGSFLENVLVRLKNVKQEEISPSNKIMNPAVVATYESVNGKHEVISHFDAARSAFVFPQLGPWETVNASTIIKFSLHVGDPQRVVAARTERSISITAGEMHSYSLLWPEGQRSTSAMLGRSMPSFLVTKRDRKDNLIRWEADELDALAFAVPEGELDASNIVVRGLAHDNMPQCAAQVDGLILLGGVPGVRSLTVDDPRYPTSESIDLYVLAGTPACLTVANLPEEHSPLCNKERFEFTLAAEDRWHNSCAPGRLLTQVWSPLMRLRVPSALEDSATGMLEVENTMWRRDERAMHNHEAKYADTSDYAKDALVFFGTALKPADEYFDCIGFDWSSQRYFVGDVVQANSAKGARAAFYIVYRVLKAAGGDQFLELEWLVSSNTARVFPMLEKNSRLALAGQFSGASARLGSDGRLLWRSNLRELFQVHHNGLTSVNGANIKNLRRVYMWSPDFYNQYAGMFKVPEKNFVCDQRVVLMAGDREWQVEKADASQTANTYRVDPYVHSDELPVHILMLFQEPHDPRYSNKPDLTICQHHTRWYKVAPSPYVKYLRMSQEDSPEGQRLELDDKEGYTMYAHVGSTVSGLLLHLENEAHQPVELEYARGFLQGLKVGEEPFLPVTEPKVRLSPFDMGADRKLMVVQFQAETPGPESVYPSLQFAVQPSTGDPTHLTIMVPHPSNVKCGQSFNVTLRLKDAQSLNCGVSPDMRLRLVSMEADDGATVLEYPSGFVVRDNSLVFAGCVLRANEGVVNLSAKLECRGEVIQTQTSASMSVVFQPPSTLWTQASDIILREGKGLLEPFSIFLGDACPRPHQLFAMGNDYSTLVLEGLDNTECEPSQVRARNGVFSISRLSLDGGVGKHKVRASLYSAPTVFVDLEVVVQASRAPNSIEVTGGVEESCVAGSKMPALNVVILSDGGDSLAPSELSMPIREAIKFTTDRDSHSVPLLANMWDDVMSGYTVPSKLLPHLERAGLWSMEICVEDVRYERDMMVVAAAPNTLQVQENSLLRPEEHIIRSGVVVTRAVLIMEDEYDNQVMNQDMPELQIRAYEKGTSSNDPLDYLDVKFKAHYEGATVTIFDVVVTVTMDAAGVSDLYANVKNNEHIDLVHLASFAYRSKEGGDETTIKLGQVNAEISDVRFQLEEKEQELKNARKAAQRSKRDAVPVDNAIHQIEKEMRAIENKYPDIANYEPPAENELREAVVPEAYRKVIASLKSSRHAAARFSLCDAFSVDDPRHLPVVNFAMAHLMLTQFCRSSKDCNVVREACKAAGKKGASLKIQPLTSTINLKKFDLSKRKELVDTGFQACLFDLVSVTNGAVHWLGEGRSPGQSRKYFECFLRRKFSAYVFDTEEHAQAAINRILRTQSRQTGSFYFMRGADGKPGIIHGDGSFRAGGSGRKEDGSSLGMTPANKTPLMAKKKRLDDLRDELRAERAKSEKIASRMARDDAAIKIILKNFDEVKNKFASLRAQAAELKAKLSDAKKSSNARKALPKKKRRR